MRDLDICKQQAVAEPMEPENHRHETNLQRRHRGSERTKLDDDWEALCDAVAAEKRAQHAKRETSESAA